MNTLIMNSCFLIHTLPLLKLHLNKIINYSRFLWVASFLSIIPLQANTFLFSKDPCLDTDKPILLIKTGACNPALYYTVLNTCSSFLSITAEANDNQSPSACLSFTYKIDLYNDGLGIYNGYDIHVGSLMIKEFEKGQTPMFNDNPFASNPNNITDGSGTYPLGVHKICWWVTDTCGNQAVLCQLFEILDCKAPTPMCKIKVDSFNMTPQGCITIYAKDFDTKSFDNCTPHDKLKFYFNGDPNQDSLTVCCDDLIASVNCDFLWVEIQLWVEDVEGNTDYCKTAILVTDTDDICCDIREYGKINGMILCSLDGKDSIEGPIVHVNLINGNFLYKQQTTSKDYKFGNLPISKYELNAFKNSDSLNHVTTFDILKITRHILGLEPFTNPFQSIAADVNNSSTLTAADGIEIRKLIVGNMDRFISPNPWKFFAVRIDTTILNSKPQEITLDLNAGINRRVDFRLVKMGDVNDYSMPLNYKPLQWSSDSIIFKFKNQQFAKGDSIHIDFYAFGFDSIVGFQGTFKFDSTRFKFENIHSTILTLDNRNIGTNFLEAGYIPISWIEPNTAKISAPQNQIIFTLDFIARQAGDLCDAIQFTSELTPKEAYQDSFLIKNISIENCNIIIQNKELRKNNILVYPNPFLETLHFHFGSQNVVPIQLQLFTSTGNCIKIQELNTNENHFEWKLSELKNGIYFLKIKSGNQIQVEKLILEN
ncbi:MAG: T9SS type A sorting domain-containing protein [Saprospiraceae bacterium]